ncbi:MAG: ABC transporter ATP-binding protein [Acetobacteraceae bacterium]|nr:ABC transporter ATP-binding protein [Acetobacteraceae bacterium]
MSAGEAASLVEVRNLSIALPAGADRALAVDDVSFDIRQGEILCIVGESGSGKSLTAAAIMRILPLAVRVRGGEVRIAGTDLLRLPEAEMRRWRGARIGMVFQEPMTALNPLMRIGRQIEEVLESHAVMAAAARRGRVGELLRAVNLPSPELLAEAYPFRLSGGQRQRVMIAMALALNPALLIADEPTTALDVTTQKQILQLLQSLQRERRMGVLFITHDFGVVADIADRVAVMQHGRIVEQGTAGAILEAPQHPYTRSLIAAVPRLEARRQGCFTRPLLAVKDISRTFVSGAGLFVARRVVPAVRQVSLAIAEGETLGVVGESGSGKSTLGRLIIRLVKADGGSVEFAGADFLKARPARLKALRASVQMIFQDPYASLNPRRTVRQILTEGQTCHGVPAAEALDRARSLLALVGMEEAVLGRYPHEFSGGQRQRIGIARALALRPRLIIADEPVSALDVSVQAQVLDLLKDVRQRFGLAMLFITHDLRVAAQVSDRIAVMQNGEIVETGPTAAIFQSPAHAYTRELLDAIPGRHWRPALGSTAADAAQAGAAQAGAAQAGAAQAGAAQAGAAQPAAPEA